MDRAGQLSRWLISIFRQKIVQKREVVLRYIHKAGMYNVFADQLYPDIHYEANSKVMFG